ncbi:MAG: HU family DNA-binding protein [Planctomycetota bacterium]|nr:MAG: HU family DNA-binding protein [Planctomycetota bacterium]
MKRFICVFTLLLVGFLSVSFGAKETSTMEKMVKEVSAKEGISQKQTRKIINEFLQAFQRNLKANKKVNLRGLGTFYLVVQKKRKWQNPKTKKVFQIPERKVVRFRPSGLLKRFINQP